MTLLELLKTIDISNVPDGAILMQDYDGEIKWTSGPLDSVSRGATGVWLRSCGDGRTVGTYAVVADHQIALVSIDEVRCTTKCNLIKTRDRVIEIFEQIKLLTAEKDELISAIHASGFDIRY
ncbi:hypothetical protein D3C84_330350 [compost metagenome]